MNAAPSERRVDSLTLRLEDGQYEPIGRLDFDAPGVSHSSGRRQDGSEYDRVKVSPPGIPGVNGLTFDGLDASLTLDLSAKALLSDYPRGIGRDTLPRLSEAVATSGLVSVTPEGLLRADVRRADVFVDLDPHRDRAGDYGGSEQAIAGTFDALRSLRANQRFRMEYGGGPRDPSLRFETNKRRGRDILATYAKGRELAEAKNRDFMYAAGPAVYQALAGSVRFERRAQGPSLVKRFCDRAIRDPYATLADVLDSGRLPVSELFRDVRGEPVQTELFSTLERMLEACPVPVGENKVAAWRWLEKEAGRWFILEAVGWNADALRDLTLRVVGNKNGWSVRKEYADRIEAAARGETADERARTLARLDTLSDTLRRAEDRPPVGGPARTAPGAQSSSTCTNP